MTGAEYIAEFLARSGMDKVFLMNGGACAFMIDAVARHKKLAYYCVQHEQAAAMAADAIWRVGRRVGVSMATSGPGATNLITGIACSFFDSIPSFHITGQVNRRESAAYLDAKVRQAGFQETKIVEMVRPITKYAVQVTTGDELKRELARAYEIATDGRMGPVLIDVPMDVQQADVGDFQDFPAGHLAKPRKSQAASLAEALNRFFAGAERPVVLFGAGIGLAGAEGAVERWLEKTAVPFVASWNGATYFNHDLPNYAGAIGVYGNRGANYVLQNSDALLVLGSRLENRQRPGNPKNFAPGAKVHVVDVDAEELKKYASDGYAVTELDLTSMPEVLDALDRPPISDAWRRYVTDMKSRFYGRDISTSARKTNTLSPYGVVKKINGMIDEDAIVICDTGACLVWVYQMFHRRRHQIFTAGGNSPMGYALPAAIAAKLESAQRQVVCFMGDGGFQLNIQELQTLRHLGLDITIVVMNNGGYGIIKQFQDSYLGGRHEGTGNGYSLPDLAKIVPAYGLHYDRVESIDSLSVGLFRRKGGAVIDVTIGPNTLIEPKVEMGRPINDQFPYVSDADFAAANPFVPFKRR